MLRPAGTRGCKVVLNEPISLEDAQVKGVIVTGSYFRKEAGGLYTHAPKGDQTCTDGAQYKAESIMALVQLSYHETTSAGDHVYKFDDPGLVEGLNELAKVGEKKDATAAEKKEQKKKKQQRSKDNKGDDEEGAGRAALDAKRQATTVASVSRAGRRSTRGVVK